MVTSQAKSSEITWHTRIKHPHDVIFVTLWSRAASPSTYLFQVFGKFSMHSIFLIAYHYFKSYFTIFLFFTIWRVELNLGDYCNFCFLRSYDSYLNSLIQCLIVANEDKDVNWDLLTESMVPATITNFFNVYKFTKMMSLNKLKHIKVRTFHQIKRTTDIYEKRHLINILK